MQHHLKKESMTDRYPNLHVVDHPLVQHKLTHIRDKNCDKFSFRAYAREITQLLTYEASRDLPVFLKDVETPLATSKFPALKDEVPVIVPILRAGLGMSDGVETLLPSAPVGHIGLYRDEQTKKPVEYLVKLPPLQGRFVFMVDPMLATGHSSVKAADILIENGARAKDIRLMVLVAAPEGVEAFSKAHPEISIITAALDEKLNENAYIVPGLGDAGDRLFGTK